MIEGKVWKFEDDIDTDQIIPSQYLLLPTVEEMKAHTFEPLVPAFSEKVNPGDVVVAGENFGSGSSREQAPLVLKELGVSAIIAKSFARIFFRNAINIGLPVVVCESIYEGTKQGDIIKINIDSGIIKNKRLEKKFEAAKLPAHIKEILNEDGLINFLNNKR